MSNKTKAILVILFGSIFGGAASPVIKIAIQEIPPFSFSFIRFFIASVFLLPMFIKQKPKFDSDFRKLILLSLLPTINIGLFAIGVKLTTASIAQMLYAGVPIIVGLIGYFLFGYRMKIQRWIYISLGLFGVLLVTILPLIQKNVPFTGDLKGNLLIILGVMCWSLYAVLSKQYQKKYNPLVITSLFFFTATIVFFFLSFFEFSLAYPWWLALDTGSLVSILYVSLFATVGVYMLNQYSYKYANPVIGSFSLYLLPVFAYFSAYILLGEKLTAGLFIGTVIVFISIALTTYAK
ncbi:hypothetical protein A2767_05045 [Candidatus Roizmanbacteria bacterium RIFCSPHIGHO2_01_FULL_35_10]|uniref:EamA domain-containing protein n=1 Tax=Candidatus Roizmanbacteria bacterium RIFCSPLOWO2_01_FULL_35_13 TaxID=1802055 RepID=A0A1F7I6W2_9BACT|nr:MAG: hypothetical protein A2767_05045 [Candidatus Roizmanbacteria bacterium RIFCSPHIGHO2_01_FULL_35_10]OGK39083.1 MAG: hypothetical protein A3A74_05665 [Candidatus Roizmanbacteria bacterium RIFCSPLOWO2_01_FULL_35_13]